MTVLSRVILIFTGLSLLGVMIGANLSIDRYEATERRLEAERQANLLAWEVYELELDNWRKRDVISVFYIESIEYDQATVTIWGYLDKRECALNIPPDGSPYSVVDFVREDHTTRVGERLYYQFGDDEASKRPVSRPPGATAVEGWQITIGPEVNPENEIVGYATHNCGIVEGSRIIVGPREFVRVSVADLLNAPFKWVSKTATLPEPQKPNQVLEE